MVGSHLRERRLLVMHLDASLAYVGAELRHRVQPAPFAEEPPVLRAERRPLPSCEAGPALASQVRHQSRSPLGPAAILEAHVCLIV